MIDLDCYLGACDALLAEADLLVARLTTSPEALDSDLSATRAKIEQVRREVERLRGMKSTYGRAIYPEWTDFPESELPWPSGRPSGPDA